MNSKSLNFKLTYKARLVFILVLVSAFLLGGLYTYRAQMSLFVWNTFHLYPEFTLKLNQDASLAFAIGNYYFNGDNSHTYDIEKTKKYYLEAVAFDPNPIDPWYQLGRIYFLQGNLLYAIRKFNRNIELHNGVENQAVMRTYYMRGLSYGYAKQFEKAEIDFLRILEWHKDNPPLPEEWALYVDLSWIYFQQGKYGEMLELMQTGFERFPDNVWVLNMYGLALLNTGDEGAKSIFERAFAEAQKLTEEDWINAYPGNDPRVASRGLNELLTVIELNMALVTNE